MAPWSFTPQNQGTAPDLPFGKEDQHSGRRPTVRCSLQGLLLASCSGGWFCVPRLCIPDAENADTGEYQQSEKACLVTAGLCKCRYLRGKNVAQSSCPRYNVNSRSDWRTVVVRRIKSFTLSHHQICINSPAAQAVTGTHWCTAGRRTLFSWRGSSGSHHYNHASHSFLNTQLSVREKLTVSADHSDLFPEENNLPLNLTQISHQSWEGVRICTLYSYLGFRHPVPANA